MNTEAKGAPKLRCIFVTVAPSLALPLTLHTYSSTFMLKLHPPQTLFWIFTFIS